MLLDFEVEKQIFDFFIYRLDGQVCLEFGVVDPFFL